MTRAANDQAPLAVMAYGTGANGVYVVDGTHPLPIAITQAAGLAAPSIIAGSSFNRPGDTTAYASGDQVGDNTTAGSLTVGTFTIAAGTYDVLDASLFKSTTTTNNASFRLHLYTTLPVVSGGDNAAWLTTLKASFAGSFDITCDRVFGDGAFGRGLSLTQAPLRITTAGGTVWYLLEARAAYGPGNAETFQPKISVSPAT